MSKYYVAETNDNQFNAANKARDDVEECFKQQGYKIDYTYINLLKSKQPKVRMIREVIGDLLRYRSGDYIYFQYPYYKNKKKMTYIITKLKKYKKVKFVAVIHDLDSLRYNKGKEEVNKEIEVLNMCSFIISHNKNMTKWLKENGCKSIIYNLELFDYLLADCSKFDNERDTDIVFAGNLSREKSEFLYKLIDGKDIGYKINLYGPNFSGENKYKKVIYCGKYPPEELIPNLEGKFGLIWDGKDLDKCSGNIGDYTKYNNPHKLSMYIAAKLPVICWSKMAIADFVRENNIGFCVDSLEDIKNILATVDCNKYEEFLDNISKVQKNVITGYYIKNALNKINNAD